MRAAYIGKIEVCGLVVIALLLHAVGWAPLARAQDEFMERYGDIPNGGTSQDFGRAAAAGDFNPPYSHRLDLPA